MDAEFVRHYAGNILPTRAIYPARYDKFDYRI